MMNLSNDNQNQSVKLHDPRECESLTAAQKLTESTDGLPAQEADIDASVQPT
jgi:hypothetical protein